MNRDALSRLEAESRYPPGVAARIESTDLRKVLYEREMLRLALGNMQKEADNFRKGLPNGSQRLASAYDTASDVLDLVDR